MLRPQKSPEHSGGFVCFAQLSFCPGLCARTYCINPNSFIWNSHPSTFNKGFTPKIMKFQDDKGYQLRTPPCFIPHKVQFKLLNKKEFIGHISEKSGFRHDWIQYSNIIRTQLLFLSWLCFPLCWCQSEASHGSNTAAAEPASHIEDQGKCMWLFPSSPSKNLLVDSGSRARV